MTQPGLFSHGAAELVKFARSAFLQPSADGGQPVEHPGLNLPKLGCPVGYRYKFCKVWVQKHEMLYYTYWEEQVLVLGHWASLNVSRINYAKKIYVYMSMTNCIYINAYICSKVSFPLAPVPVTRMI